MDNVYFQVFEPDGKSFHWTPDNIIAPLWIVPILLAWVFEDNIKDNQTLQSYVTFYVAVLCITSIGFLIASFFTYKPLNGTLSSDILFSDDGITINNKLYPLDEVSELDFTFRDYYGYKNNFSLGRSLNPGLSQGVNNYVSFNDKDGSGHVIYFQLKYQSTYLTLTDFINKAVNAKKMGFKQAIDLIGIENVSS